MWFLSESERAFFVGRESSCSEVVGVGQMLKHFRSAVIQDVVYATRRVLPVAERSMHPAMAYRGLSRGYEPWEQCVQLLCNRKSSEVRA
jgi:hypothetical protein